MRIKIMQLPNKTQRKPNPTHNCICGTQDQFHNLHRARNALANPSIMHHHQSPAAPVLRKPTSIIRQTESLFVRPPPRARKRNIPKIPRTRGLSRSTECLGVIGKCVPVCTTLQGYSIVLPLSSRVAHESYAQLVAFAGARACVLLRLRCVEPDRRSQSSE